MMESHGHRVGRAGYQRERTGAVLPNVAPSNVYPTADGQLILIAANQDSVFGRLAALMDEPELAADGQPLRRPLRPRRSTRRSSTTTSRCGPRSTTPTTLLDAAARGRRAGRPDLQGRGHARRPALRRPGGHRPGAGPDVRRAGDAERRPQAVRHARARSAGPGRRSASTTTRSTATCSACPRTSAPGSRPTGSSDGDAGRRLRARRVPRPDRLGPPGRRSSSTWSRPTSATARSPTRTAGSRRARASAARVVDAARAAGHPSSSPTVRLAARRRRRRLVRGQGAGAGGVRGRLAVGGVPRRARPRAGRARREQAVRVGVLRHLARLLAHARAASTRRTSSASRPAAASAPRRWTRCSTASARSSSRRPAATGTRRRTTRTCSTSTPSTPTSSRRRRSLTQLRSDPMTTTLTTIDLDSPDLAWIDHAIAGSDRPARLSMLHADAASGTRTRVREVPRRLAARRGRPPARRRGDGDPLRRADDQRPHRRRRAVPRRRAAGHPVGDLGRGRHARAVVFFSGPGGGWADGEAPDAGDVSLLDRRARRDPPARAPGLVGSTSVAARRLRRRSSTPTSTSSGRPRGATRTSRPASRCRTSPARRSSATGRLAARAGRAAASSS